MEFPGLGKYCSDPSCKQLDFLPWKCDACGNVYCQEHFSYINHHCPNSYKKNVQVPACPLCNEPVPLKRGEAPDMAVSEHIDRDCQSDPAKSRRKIFVNKCSRKGCHIKEIMPVHCSECKENFCLKHRHPTDHNCEGAGKAARRKAANAATARISKLNGNTSKNSNPITAWARNSYPSKGNSNTNRDASKIQGNLSEDEALARALALSMNDMGAASCSKSSKSQQVVDDEMLARAIMQSEKQQTSVSPLKNEV